MVANTRRLNGFERKCRQGGRFKEPGTLIHKGRVIDYAVELWLRDNTIEGNTMTDWTERPQQRSASVFALGRGQMDVARGWGVGLQTNNNKKENENLGG